jgi:hypothetical protein
MQRHLFSSLAPAGAYLGRFGAFLALLAVVAAPAGAVSGPKLIRLTVTPVQVKLDAADAQQLLVVT